MATQRTRTTILLESGMLLGKGRNNVHKRLTPGISQAEVLSFSQVALVCLPDMGADRKAGLKP